MPIKKINALQNPNSIDLSKSAEKEYIQSLANLGQRIGIKGDSIKYSSFDLIDIFEELVKENSDIVKFNNIKDNKQKYVGFLYYQTNQGNNTGKIGIINRKNLEEANGILDNVNILFNNEYSDEQIDKNNFEYSITNNLFASNFFEVDFKLEAINYLNNIEYYLNKSIIKVKKDNNGNLKAYFLLFGKVFNSKDELEILYDEYDIKKNEPLRSIRLLRNPNNDNDNQQYFLFDFNYQKDLPFLNIYTLTKNDLIENDSTILYNGAIFSEIINYLSESKVLLTGNSEINRLFDNIINGSDDTIFNYFYVVGNKITINFEYNSENDVKVFVSKNELEKNYFYTDENKESNLSLVEIRINYINNDINTLYPKLLEYYHNYHFCKNKSIFNLRILQNLYEELVYKNAFNYVSDLEIENFNISNNQCVLYFPLDTSIDYICNKNNEFEIFYTDNIFINKLNLEDIIKDNVIYNEDIFDNILFSSNKFTQSIFEIYNLRPVYNSLYPEYIQYIQANFKYSLPYIDIDSTNWIINGQNTGLTSYLQNNNLQNIVIINTLDYDGKKIKGEYLNNVSSNIEIYYNNENLSHYEFKVNRNIVNGENINVPEIKTLTFHTALPNITTTKLKNPELYKNTLVISMSNFIEEQDYINLQDDDFLMVSVWRYNQEEGDWEILKDKNSNTIIDLSKFLNFGLLKERKLGNKSYIFKYIGILLDNLDKLDEYCQDSKLMIIQKEYNKLTKNVGESDQEIHENTLSTLFRFHKASLSINNNILKEDLKNLELKYRYLNLDDEEGTYSTPDIQYDYNEAERINKLTDDNASAEYQSVISNESVNVLENIKSWQVEKLINENVISSENEKITKEINDYIFYSDIPNINLSEVFLSNAQFMTRMNFLTLDKVNVGNGKKIKYYNTFIGSKPEIGEKNVFCIKSGNTNYNIGTNTLINPDHINKFDIQDKFLLDFEEVELHSSKLYSSSIYDHKEKICNSEINISDQSIQSYPIYKYSKTLNISFKINDSLTNYMISNDDISFDKEKLFKDNNVNDEYRGILVRNSFVNGIISETKDLSKYIFDRYIQLSNDPNTKYIEFNIIKYLCDNFELFYNDQNSPIKYLKYQFKENQDFDDNNALINCEIDRLIKFISNSYTNNSSNNLFEKMFIVKYKNYLTLAINEKYLLDNTIKLNNSNYHIINVLFNLRLEKIETIEGDQTYNKYIIVAE